MADLIYIAITSLDGYIEDESGGFDWAMPDPETHAFVNQLESEIGTYLYGRRIYETMAVWERIGREPDPEGEAVSSEELEYAEVWRSAEKIVFSRTLPEVWTPRTRLEREFDPEMVRELKDRADRDVSVSGPGLAQHAFADGLVDQVHLFVFPIIVGGGKPGLPGGVRLELGLIDQRRFGNGVVHLHYGRQKS